LSGWGTRLPKLGLRSSEIEQLYKISVIKRGLAALTEVGVLERFSHRIKDCRPPGFPTHVSLIEGDVAAATGGVFTQLIFPALLNFAEDSLRQPLAATSLAEGGF